MQNDCFQRDYHSKVSLLRINGHNIRRQENSMDLSLLKDNDSYGNGNFETKGESPHSVELSSAPLNAGR